MSDFAILTDSSCDLTRDLRERFGVENYLHGILVFPDGHQEKADLDWGNMSAERFYGGMKEKKELYTTAQPGMQDFIDLLEAPLKQGRDVLFLALASGLSGTYQTSCIVAQELMEKYPERKIRCVDTRRYCGAQALLISRASELRAAGKSLDETADWVEANRLRVHQMGVLEDLFFCKRMGRVSGTAAVMGTLVGIRPLADLNEEGFSTVLGKVKGRKAAVAATMEYIRQTVEKPEEQIFFISQSARMEQAQELKALLEETFHPREVIITTVCQSCGVAVGPGLYAVFYMGKEISRNLEEEKKLIEKISKG